MKRHLAYLRYVLRHKYFVFIACLRCGVSLWRAIIHDWSKFLPCEWDAYARSFYNRDGSKRDWKTRDCWDKMEFDAAWNHHQKHNDHHWQYWLLTNDSDEPQSKPLLMPPRCWREMVADWWGAGKAITGTWDARNWYIKNASKIKLHEVVRPSVEQLLSETEPHFIRENEMLARRIRILGY
jgi:hypothetical protein